VRPVEDDTPGMFYLDGLVVKKYFANWKQIGTELGLKPDMLESIKADNPRDCFQQTLYRWLRLSPNPMYMAITGSCSY